MSQKQYSLPHRSKVGAVGEQIAVSYLLTKHFRVLERNFKARYGEIDIVALDGPTLVFVEVKTRSTTAFGSPESSVTGRKLAEVIQTGEYYLLLHPNQTRDMRIDVVAIMLDPVSLTLVSLRHLRSVT